MAQASRIACVRPWGPRPPLEVTDSRRSYECYRYYPHFHPRGGCKGSAAAHRILRGLVITKPLAQPKERARLNGSAGLPDNLLEDVAYALEADSRLATASEVLPARLRDTVAFSRAYRPLLEELRLVMTELAHEIAARRAEAGREALKVYRLAKGLARPEDRALLVPHLESTKRHFRNKARKPAPGEEPQVPPVETAKKS